VNRCYVLIGNILSGRGNQHYYVGMYVKYAHKVHDAALKFNGSSYVYICVRTKHGLSCHVFLF
jgi:hypothetical protein